MLLPSVMLVEAGRAGLRVVAPEFVGAQVQDVEVGVAVVVDVADRNAHGVTTGVETAFVRDVRESKFAGIEVVAEQPVAQD